MRHRMMPAQRRGAAFEGKAHVRRACPGDRPRQTEFPGLRRRSGWGGSSEKRGRPHLLSFRPTHLTRDHTHCRVDCDKRTCRTGDPDADDDDGVDRSAEIR